MSNRYKPSNGLLVTDTNTPATTCDSIGEVWLCHEHWLDNPYPPEDGSGWKPKFWLEIVGQDSNLYQEEDQGPVFLAATVELPNNLSLTQLFELVGKIFEWYFGEPSDTRIPYPFEGKFTLVRDI